MATENYLSGKEKINNKQHRTIVAVIFATSRTSEDPAGIHTVRLQY